MNGSDRKEVLEKNLGSGLAKKYTERYLARPGTDDASYWVPLISNVIPLKLAVVPVQTFLIR